jgi:hypothetical protein
MHPEPCPERPRRRSRPAIALLVALSLILALPITATARGEAAPVTLGDWMRNIHVSSDREIDLTQDGLAAAAPPAPMPAVQTSSEPAAPKEPVTRNQVPRLWFSGKPQTLRKRRRRRLR